MSWKTEILGIVRKITALLTYTRTPGMMPLRLVVNVGRSKHDTRRGIDLSNPVQLVDDAVDKWLFQQGKMEKWNICVFARRILMQQRWAKRERSTLAESSRSNT